MRNKMVLGKLGELIKISHWGGITMPFINVIFAKERTLEQKQKLADAITREAMLILNVNTKWVKVVFC